MSNVTDVDRGDVHVEVVDDDDKDVGAVDRGCSGTGHESVAVRTRLDALRDSVVARLLMDNRPPHLHTSACPLTTRRPPDDRPGLRSVPPPVDLSAGKTVYCMHYDHCTFCNETIITTRIMRMFPTRRSPDLAQFTV